jgi:TolB protein
LLSVDMDEVYTRKDWDGPPPSLWLFDLQRQTAKRLTPKGLFAWDGCWLDNDTILFVSQAVGEKSSGIYRMTISKNPKELLKHAQRPSASRP